MTGLIIQKKSYPIETEQKQLAESKLNLFGAYIYGVATGIGNNRGATASTTVPTVPASYLF